MRGNYFDATAFIPSRMLSYEVQDAAKADTNNPLLHILYREIHQARG